jgi:hypothetical protein
MALASKRKDSREPRAGWRRGRSGSWTGGAGPNLPRVGRTRVTSGQAAAWDGGGGDPRLVCERPFC